MRPLSAAAFAVLMLTVGCAKGPQQRPAQGDVEAARAAAQLLGSSLKTRLVEAIAADGAVAAVRVCSLEAPAIAETASAASGYEVSRTALRVRNPANAPDAFERRRLELFVEAASRGEDARSLEYAEVVRESGATVFRWMKPIVMEGPCVTCHGEAIAPALKAEIDSLYPADAATGFREGAIRGAFSVRKEIAG